MKNVKLLIEYDGTNYNGWQRQTNGIGIQQVIEDSIKKLTGEDVIVNGSSRTDAGVHARGFVANFNTNATVPAANYKYALKGKLPDDIVILESEEVPEDFHARYSSKGKTYSYTILNRAQPSALLRNYVYHVKYKLDINAMKEACKAFIGTHDFKGFKSPGSSVKTSVRTIYDLHIENQGDEIKIFVSGDGFLYNMVRIIVGTLVLVGRGKIKPNEIEEIIRSGDRKRAGKCAPPTGLYLEKVFY